MIFATVNVLQQATLFDLLAWLPGNIVDDHQVFFKVSEARAFDTASDAAETQINDFFAQTNGFKQLRATVRGDGRDTHLRHDFQQALADRLAVVRLRFQWIAQHFTAAVQVSKDIVRQPWVNSGRTKAQQHSKVMRVTGRTGFNHDVTVGTQAFLAQAVVNGTGCHWRGDQRLTFSHFTVAQDQDHVTVTDRRFSFVCQRNNRVFQRQR